MANVKLKALRRNASGKVQVQTNGGWMNWSLVSPVQQKTVLALPEVQRYTVGDEFDSDPFKRDEFLVVFGVDDPFKDDTPPKDLPQDEDADQGGIDIEDAPEFKPAEGGEEVKFEMPAQETIEGSLEGKSGESDGGEGDQDGEGGEGQSDSDQEGDGESESEGAGDDDCFATKLSDGESELVPFSEPFVARFMAAGEELGQAILEQAVAISRAETAEACHAVVADMAELVEKHQTTTDKLVKDLTARIEAGEIGGKNGGGAIVTVRIVKPAETKDIDGLAHHQMPKLLKFASLGLHCYLPGPPGTGKSHASEQVSKLLGWRYASVSLGPTTPESRLWGGMDANGKFHEPPFVSGAKFARDNKDSGFIFCMDEMDNGHPGIIATINSALANGWFTTPSGEFVEIGPNFVIVAAANTYGTGATAEFAGRNRLDAATLDRFMYLPWDTDKDVEKALVHAHLAEHPKGKFIADDWLKVWNTTREKVDAAGLKVFVSMRGAINGARLLAAEVPVKDVWNAVLGNKLPEDQKRKVNPL